MAELPYRDTTKNLCYRLSGPDDDASSEIDSSFVTDRIYRVEPNPEKPTTSNTSFGFGLTEIQLETPLHKKFPDHDDNDEDEDDEDDKGESNEFTLLVEDLTSVPSNSEAAAATPSLVGFITAKFSAWNCRLTISDIEIRPSHRGQGVGKNLMSFAENRARSRYPVKHMWLEVSNVNVPAIKSYLRMGFSMAGLDMSLYVGTESDGEFAIFMWKRLE